ncbi:MAG: Spy/CpxP family protein refolding chaperone [Bryobacteraceae bacterium]
MKKTLVTLLLWSALATALMAQSAGGPHNGRNYVKAMTVKLGLTAEQQSQATAIFSNAHTTESTLRASMRSARQGLEDAVKSDNTVGIEQLSTTIGNLTAQATLAHAKTRAAFYRILTPEQRTTLGQLEIQRPAWFRGGGRSGPRESDQ